MTKLPGDKLLNLRKKKKRIKKAAKAKGDRKTAKKLEQGEEYVSSGDEAPEVDPL